MGVKLYCCQMRTFFVFTQNGRILGDSSEVLVVNGWVFMAISGHLPSDFELEWRFYVLSASKAIFRARA